MQKVHSARSAGKKMNDQWLWGEEELPEEVISDSWADGGAGDCSRWRWWWNPVTATVLPLCRDTNRCPLPRWFILSILFLPSPRLSLSVSLSISLVFLCFSVSVVSLSTQSVSLSQFPPLFLCFLLLFFFLSSEVTIYRGRGSGVDPAPSHRCPCMGRMSPALLWRRPRWQASLAGHGFSVFSSWGGAGGVRFWF